MVSLKRIPRALVPLSSDAARQIGAPNYDEFQGDHEIWELLQARPECVLGVTMAHCASASLDEILEEGSEPALTRAREQMERLIRSPLTRELDNALYIYGISGNGDREQWGVGGLALTSEIGADSPGNTLGPIIRNEGIREPKARGRATLIERTRAVIGVVNLAVDDASGALLRTMESYAAARECDFSTDDEQGYTHRIWLVENGPASELEALVAAERYAYVADGNHRSAAARMVGLPAFPAVFFPVQRMGIEPYNRLVRETGCTADQLLESLAAHFEIEELPSAFQPEATNELGLFARERWHLLRARPGAYDASDPVDSIAARFVQRRIFEEIFGFEEEGDARIDFVGGNKDARYLQQQVQGGAPEFALTLPPVTPEQFIAVCQAGRFMPPKSTWFSPKIRSGLVSTLL